MYSIQIWVLAETLVCWSSRSSICGLHAYCHVFIYRFNQGFLWWNTPELHSSTFLANKFFLPNISCLKICVFLTYADQSVGGCAQCGIWMVYGVIQKYLFSYPSPLVHFCLHLAYPSPLRTSASSIRHCSMILQYNNSWCSQKTLLVDLMTTICSTETKTKSTQSDFI